MSLQEYLRILRERWLVVLVATVFGMAGAAAYFFVKPPKYTANLQFYVSSQGADTPQAAFQGAQLSQDRVASYTELVTGPRVLSDVISRLNLTETPDELAKEMTATSKLDSVLIDLSVTDPDPRQAAAIANAVGDAFPPLVAQLERPTDPAKPAAVAVRVVQQAPVPDKPSSTGLPIVLALGLLAGLATGLGGALARNALDTSVKTPEQLRAAAGSPNLGTIAFDAQVAKEPLAVRADPHSPRSEALRQLRTNLQFVDVDTPRKVILLTSSLPGEGKTTTAADLASVLASAGGRVLLMDADLRRPRLADRLGLDNTIGLTSVLSGRMRPDQVIQPWGGASMDVLGSGPLPPNPSELLGSRQMLDLIKDLRGRYEFVIIDSPPLLPVTDAAAIAPSTDGAILVCRYRSTSRRQVAQAAEALEAVSAQVLGTVFTMVPPSGPHAYAKYQSYYRSATPAASRPPVVQPRPSPQPRPPSRTDRWLTGADPATRR